MGLQGQIKVTGIPDSETSNAYLKIGSIELQELGKELEFEFLSYFNKSTRDADESDTLMVFKTGALKTTDQYYIDEIKPIMDQLKTKVYGWAKTNGYESFIDVI